MTQVVICCGVGGAGKTTTSAALAVAHARDGARTVVLTIDPARRLADALGLATLGNTATAIPLPAGFRGTLDALMLDRKATWDEVVRRHAPDTGTADRLLENRYYRALSERLTGGHEYMATEKLHELVASGRWDVVVVDTPPSQHALDFLSAPDRIRRILDQRLLGALLKPQSGLLGMASRRVVAVVRRMAGEAVLDDLTQFFDLVADLADGFRERGAEVHDLLASDGCTWLLVVHTPAPRLEETFDFLGELRERGLRFGGVVANRWVPGLHHPLTDLIAALPRRPDGADASDWTTATTGLRDLVQRRLDEHTTSRHIAGALLAHGARPIWTVPDLGAIESLDGLDRVAAHLPPLSAPGLT